MLLALKDEQIAALKANNAGQVQQPPVTTSSMSLKTNKEEEKKQVDGVREHNPTSAESSNHKVGASISRGPGSYEKWSSSKKYIDTPVRVTIAVLPCVEEGYRHQVRPLQYVECIWKLRATQAAGKRGVQEEESTL